MSILSAVDDDFVVSKHPRQNGHPIMPSVTQDGNQENVAGDNNVLQQPSTFPTNSVLRDSQETEINWNWESGSSIEGEPSLGGKTQ